MPWVSIGASVAGSAISGMMGGSKEGERMAKDASAAAIREQEDARRQATANLSPYMNTGTAANQRLAQALGIADPTGYAARPTRQKWEDWAQNWHFNQYGQDYNRNSNMAAMNQLIDKKYNKDLAAWEKGKEAYLASNPDAGGDGHLLKNFTNEDFVQDPGYNFRMAEGNKGIDRAAAARGGYDSGATLKALTKYNQDFASNEFGNAYNRDAANKSREYGFLSGTSGAGQQAAGTLAGVSQNAANAIGNAGIQTANQVAGYQMQNDANLNNSIQSGIGNALYALRTAQTQPTTGYGSGSQGGYQYGYSAAPSSTKPWWQS